MMDYPESELVTLKEALDITGSSDVPGALNVDGKQLVQWDEEPNTYTYVPDIDADKLHFQHDISEEQLEEMIPGALDQRWIPTGNFVIM